MYLEKFKHRPRVTTAIKEQHIRVAIIDLYNNEQNEGMRCIQNLLNSHPLESHQTMSWKVYDARFKNEVPDESYDIYISTGGPGSPLPNGEPWENKYFDLMDSLFAHNTNSSQKKYLFFICHSFQLICRHLGIGEVNKRHSTAFGIFPVHETMEGKKERLFKNLSDPFYAVDSRDYQLVQPDMHKIDAMGAKILAIEKERPHVAYERAVMAIRFSDEIFGTQFHPEADPIGMRKYLLRPDKMEHVIHHHGKEKYKEMLVHLEDEDKLKLTQGSILPAFLNQVINNSLITA